MNAGNCLRKVVAITMRETPAQMMKSDWVYYLLLGYSWYIYLKWRLRQKFPCLLMLPIYIRLTFLFYDDLRAADVNLSLFQGKLKIIFCDCLTRFVSLQMNQNALMQIGICEFNQPIKLYVFVVLFDFILSNRGS